jgi:hypothetical protein
LPNEKITAVHTAVEIIVALESCRRVRRSETTGRWVGRATGFAIGRLTPCSAASAALPLVYRPSRR